MIIIWQAVMIFKMSYFFHNTAPLFLFFLTSCLYYSPPLSYCQVFFKITK
nr:MAG TPA: hypothetical protein [Caudoviricetes sp.]